MINAAVIPIHNNNYSIVRTLLVDICFYQVTNTWTMSTVSYRRRIDIPSGEYRGTSSFVLGVAGAEYVFAWDWYKL